MLKDLHAFALKSVPGLALIAALGASSAWAQPVITSSFDTDLEGWSAVGFEIDDSFGAILSGQVLSVVNNTADMVHDAGGDSDPAFTGNPGGFARFTDVVVDPGSFANAPAAFLGDLSAYAGGTFSFDHRLFNEGSDATSVQPYAVAFISGDPNDLNAYGAVFPGPGLGAADTDWVNLSVNLTDGGPNGLQKISDLDLGIFDPDFAGDTVSSLSGGVLQTAATLDAVLSNVTRIVVAFEIVDNNSSQTSEAGGIDNVTLRGIPEPATFVVLSVASALMARSRCKR